MNHHYQDIVEKLGKPLWYDERAVPRYCEFAPREISDVYADEAVLLEIQCQNCGVHFKVAMSQDGIMDTRIHKLPSLAEQIKNEAIHYGDPPNAECCAGGNTMNSIPLRILEYWTRKGNIFKWTRDTTLEKEISAEWA